MVDLLQINEDSFKARNVQENFDRLRDLLTAISSNVQDIGDRLANILGGQWLQGLVSSTVETEFPHNLGRIPSVVFLSVAIDNNGGPGVRGIATGGLALPGNATVWTATSVFVAATVTGDYGFLVL